MSYFYVFRIYLSFGFGFVKEVLKFLKDIFGINTQEMERVPNNRERKSRVIDTNLLFQLRKIEVPFVILLIMRAKFPSYYVKICLGIRFLCTKIPVESILGMSTISIEHRCREQLLQRLLPLHQVIYKLSALGHPCKYL